MRPTGSQAIEAYIPVLCKVWCEKKVEAWDFKKEKNSSQEYGTGKCFINKCLPCHAETIGHREDFKQAGSPVYYIWLIFFVVISGDRSLPGIGSLLHYF